MIAFARSPILVAARLPTVLTHDIVGPCARATLRATSSDDVDARVAMTHASRCDYTTQRARRHHT
jgi:hypothetical protein